MTSAAEFDAPFALTQDQIWRYAEDGFVKLRGVLSPAAVADYEPEITSQVIRLNTQHVPLAERDTYIRAFLQVMNLWRHSDRVKEFVFSRRLARIAAELMGVRRVRLYHDQALYKEAGGGFTPWHVDQHYWPLSTDRTITAWVPLQDTSADMGPLTFAVAATAPVSAVRWRSPTSPRRRSTSSSHRAVTRSMTRRSRWATSASSRLDDPPGAEQRQPNIAPSDDHHLHGRRHPRDRAGEQGQRADIEAWLDGKPAGSVADGPLNPLLCSAE